MAYLYDTYEDLLEGKNRKCVSRLKLVKRKSMGDPGILKEPPSSFIPNKKKTEAELFETRSKRKHLSPKIGTEDTNRIDQICFNLSSVKLNEPPTPTKDNGFMQSETC